MAKTPEEKAKHRRRNNVKDVIRDEIYGAHIAASAYDNLDANFIVINKHDVAKIAKSIMKRVAIGPI